MINYFYSKFDNINWSWWKPESISPEMKPILENINRQVKSYFPSNILIYHPTIENYTLISERFQIDRDNAGRAFSFRNYFIANKNEIKSSTNWLDFLQQFNNPIDYHFPEKIEPPLIINSNKRSTKQKLIFESLFEHCTTGSKICIKDDDIAKVNRRSNKEINSINFTNFPDGNLFLETLCLLPLSISKLISFCFNYEDDFININDNKLGFINIIFCGDKSIVVDTFHLDEKINFDSLSKQGFKVNDISSSVQNELHWDSVYDFLTNENNRDSLIILNSIYEKYSQQLTNKPIQELTSMYLKVYALLNPDDKAISDIYFVQELVANTGLTDSIKKTILNSYLKKIDFLYTLNHIYELTLLCRRFNLTEELDNSFLNKSSHPVFNNTDLATIINDVHFNELSKSIKTFLLNNITSNPLKVKDLSEDNYFAAYNKALKALKKNENFDYLWMELGSSGINFSSSNYKTIQNLFSLTKNEKAYLTFLENQYHTTSGNFWLNEIKKNNFEIRLNGTINSLDDCLTCWNKINDISKGVFEKSSVKELYSLIVEYIQSIKDIFSLFRFYQEKTSALLNSQSNSSFRSLYKIIETRVGELLNEVLKSDRSQFNVFCKRTLNDDLSKKALYSLFNESQVFYEEKINSKRKIARALHLLKILKIDNSAKLSWLSTILSKQSLIEESHNEEEKKEIEEKFKKSIATIKGWKEIDNDIINEFKNTAKFIITLPHIHISKRKATKILAITGILVFIIWLTASLFSNKISIVKVPNNNLSLEKDSTSIVRKSGDSNKLVLDEAERFLNNSFFNIPSDTLNFYQFSQKHKEIAFIKFSFDYANFSIYKVKNLDTIQGNAMWNAFVKKYNDSTVKSIELQTVHTVTDSFSKIYRIKILPK